MKDYSKIKIGDRVRFTIVRDPRFHPDVVERKVGTATCACIAGWRVLTSKVTNATFTVTENNYLEHRTPGVP